jgi:hypothetical protein
VPEQENAALATSVVYSEPESASCGCQWTPIGILDPSGTESRKAKMAKYRNELGSDLESGFGFRNPKTAQKKEKRKFIKI